MAALPDVVKGFLACERIAVVGVSRDPRDFSRAIFRRLAATGRDVHPVNPAVGEIEGRTCYPDLESVPGPVRAVMVLTPPAASADVVRAGDGVGASHVWFHRAFGGGSVSEEAVEEATGRGLQCIVGGCPMMYCDPVDLGHRCMRWWLGRRGRVPT